MTNEKEIERPLLSADYIHEGNFYNTLYNEKKINYLNDEQLDQLRKIVLYFLGEIESESSKRYAANFLKKVKGGL